MRIDIITIFPKMFGAVLGESIIKRARQKRVVEINIFDLRSFTRDKHKKVDDRPFGGGPGMVMRAEPFFEAVNYIRTHTVDKRTKPRVILMGPGGKIFDYRVAEKMAKLKHAILLCGHYEGIDERVRRYLADEEISLGDFILTGGEIPAMAVIDAVVRLLPGALGNQGSSGEESFYQGLLEYPQYTRPASYRNMKVPQVLLSGDHERIRSWRLREAIKITKERRPDLLRKRFNLVKHPS